MWSKGAVLMILGVVFFVIEEASLAPQPQITFENGKWNVDFMGFKASAGINGQGLAASAENPYGQKASAGANGHIKQDGSLGGTPVTSNLTADAQAADDIKTGASFWGDLLAGRMPTGGANTNG